MYKNVNLPKKRLIGVKEEDLFWTIITLSVLVSAGYAILSLIMQIMNFQMSFNIGLPH